MVKRAISNITHVMVRKQTEIMSVASMLMIVGVVTKVFGLLFNSIAAGYVGTDAYNSFVFASNLPELISQVILFGGISASILPILSNVLEGEGEQRFYRVFSSLINLSLIAFTILAALVALGADQVLPWFIEQVIRPKEAISPTQMAELSAMLRALMIPQVILGISIYLTTALNIYERFLVPQLAPLFYNIGRLIALYALLPILGKSPWVLVWGTLLGAIIHLLIQIPVFRHVGIRYQFVLDLRDKFIQKIAVVAVPRVGAISVEQIGITIDKFIAFGLVNNALALYNLATLIISVPLSIIGASFATASFPTLAKAFNSQDRIVASQVFLKIANQIIFFAIPAAVLLLVMRVPVARLVYGIFGSEIGFLETYTIAWVILFFAPGLVLESLRTFLYRTFYAAHDTIRPLVVSIVVMISGAVTGILFTNYFSHFNTFAVQKLTFNTDFFLTKEAGASAVGGLALSSTVVFTIEAIVLIYWLNKRYLHAAWGDILWPFLKKLVAGAAMMLSCYLIYKIWAGLEDTERTVYLLVLTVTTTAAGLMIYLGTCWLLQIAEVKVFIDFLVKYPNLKVLKRFKSFDPIPETIDYQ
jgi:putative peptidoglycan lipid II flippase